MTQTLSQEEALASKGPVNPVTEIDDWGAEELEIQLDNKTYRGSAEEIMDQLNEYDIGKVNQEEIELVEEDGDRYLEVDTHYSTLEMEYGMSGRTYSPDERGEATVRGLLEPSETAKADRRAPADD